MEKNNLDQSDLDFINNNVTEKQPMENLQDSMPESVASVTYKLITPKGFPVLFTMRGNSDESLIARMEAQETEFVMKNYQPDIYKGKGSSPAKIVEYVPNRSCPKCGAQLIYFEAKGAKNIKCSTAKWDFTTKKATGCDFVEWSDSKPSGTVAEQSVGGVMLATQAQSKLIQDKWPELWQEGMTKVQASQIIQTNFSK